MHNHDVQPFRVAHLVGVPWRGAADYWLVGRAMRDLYETSPGFTGFCGGQFVAAGGIVRATPWMGEGWAIMGPLVASHRLWVHRTVKRSILEVARAMGLRRVQCTVLADFSAGCEWAQALGFHFEAQLKNVGAHGEPANLYVLFPGE